MTFQFLREGFLLALSNLSPTAPDAR